MDIAEIIRNLKDRYWGLPEQDIDWLVQADLPKPAINISTVSDYKRACSLYGEMEKNVGKDEWRSPVALRLLALGAEVRRFQTNYEAAYGYSPATREQDESTPKELPEWYIRRGPICAAMYRLELIGTIEDSGRRRPNREGRPEIVYVARTSWP